ncbi:hypothetical protein H312_03424 [Anncaliia algerae PRA339]|uniref:Uncharacterized protein n=1 Tax=Anncaliia algerae PRA339 TaxID=1288291 RepID=A0A059EWE5_9MICR|nr:hypothetical protein H312_03424 [Anncaliia algerae PRA339]
MFFNFEKNKEKDKSLEVPGEEPTKTENTRKRLKRQRSDTISRASRKLSTYPASISSSRNMIGQFAENEEKIEENNDLITNNSDLNLNVNLIECKLLKKNMKKK